MALAEEERLGYKLSELLFPVRPFKIDAGDAGEKEIELMKNWISNVETIRNIMRAISYMQGNLWIGLNDATIAYCASLFPNIKGWFWGIPQKKIFFSHVWICGIGDLFPVLLIKHGDYMRGKEGKPSGRRKNRSRENLSKIEKNAIYKLCV